ncbi:L-lactate dehydrogenase [Bacillus testis]|uniref:L-lactate dehydrogenase n=1 Tax=Bacillus testis TaxID=1622072 RepID=UPI00067EE692|nr:L-lactate dehydrogenase [Bacillus testis]
MICSTRKVAIIGTGFVGASAGYSIVNQNIVDELVLIDVNRERAYGEVMDLQHCVDFTTSRTKVRLGSYEDCKNMDIIIVTAGGPPKPGQTRLDTLEISAKIAKSIVHEVMKTGFSGIFLVASNPVDIITYLIWKESGLPRNQVLGTGTSLDSSRLKSILSEHIDVDPRSIQGYTMGEHGDSQFVAWSHLTIGGKPFMQILEEHKEKYSGIDLDEITDQVRKAGFEILNRKGTTYYGIGNAIAYITRSIFNDDYKIIAVSTVLDGEYGMKDVCMGVPAIITRSGVKEVVELRLTEDEMEKFRHSEQILKEHMAIIGL